MHLDLEQHDDAQRIFESLNSTGLALSEADKVRNLVLMGLDVHEQERVYTDYWNRIEVNVGYDTGAFLRWYLVTRTSRIPRQDQVYESFKKYITETGLRGAELLDGVRKYSTYYRQIRTATTGSSKIDLRLRRLNLLKTDVVLPLLMPLFESRETGEITDLDLAECIRTVESYIFRRYIAEVPTNALNKVFATVYRDVKRIRPENRSFAEVLGYSLRKRSGSGAFPDDAEFISSLEVKNLYNFKGERRKYLFECLENLDSNDTRDIANGIEDGSLTIEHVMPQTLTQAWHDELGDEAQRIYEQWLNRLGNLTVTGYNSSYSNSSYSTKRTMKHGFMESPFRLNLEMRSAEHWGEDQLAARTRRLCADALTYWIYPESDFEPARPQLPTEALGTDTNFTGRAAVSFTWNEHHATVANWRDLTARVFTILLVEHRDEFLQWARTSDWFRVGAAYDPDENGVYRLDDSIGWNASSSTWTKVSLMRRVFSHLELDPEELIITLRSDETAERGQETAETAEGENFPYLEIVKFLPRLVELEGMATDDPLVQETVEEFMQSFHPFRDEQPLKTLGTSVRKFCADPERRAAATAEETIALISSKVDETEHVDPDALAEAAVGAPCPVGGAPAGNESQHLRSRTVSFRGAPRSGHRLRQDGEMAMSQMSPAQQRILDYWWMLELFSPQPLPKLTPRSTRPEDRQVVAWTSDAPPVGFTARASTYGKYPAGVAAYGLSRCLQGGGHLRGHALGVRGRSGRLRRAPRRSERLRGGSGGPRRKADRGHRHALVLSLGGGPPPPPGPAGSVVDVRF